jgi:hypothetical protein
MVIALVVLSRQKVHCQIPEVCDVCCAYGFYTSTRTAHNEIKESVPPAEYIFFKEKRKKLRSMAFWMGGGGVGDG